MDKGTKRYRKPRKCHGCGKNDVWSDHLCGECDDLMRLGRDHKRWVDRCQAFKKYTIGTNKIRTDMPVVDQYMKSDKEILDALFAWLETRTVEAGTWSVYPDTVDEWGRKEWRGKDINAYEDGRSVMCLLTDEEAAFVKLLLEKLRESHESYYKAGFTKGRDLLQGLAEGSLTTDKINEWCEKFNLKTTE